MKYFALINFLVMLLVGIATNSLAQTKLTNPHAPNTFLDSYAMPDSTVRFIGSEHGSTRELFFIDRLTDGTITEPVFFPESLGGLEFNFAGVDCKMLPLKNGDVLLGINQGDCDYAPYSSLARFNAEGEVIWAVSMEHFIFNFFVHKLTLVDSHIICLISDQSDTLYFDLDGHEVAHNLAYMVYDTVIPAPIGYYATSGDDLFYLDEAFEVVDFTSLEGDIRALSISGDTQIIVSTSSSLVILDKNLDLAVHSAVFANFDLVTTSADWVWIGRKNGGIIQLDYLLQPHDTISMPEGIQLKSMLVIHETITLGGNYISATGASIFIHTTDAGQFNFEIKKDVSLVSVSTEQPVFYSFEPFADPWGFNIPYKDVEVTLVNTGQDTIQALTVLYGAGSGCSICHGESHRWAFDSLNFYPGSQMDFSLGDFSVWCITQSPSTFCLSVLPADSLPETDQLNNRFCIDVDAFLTSVNEVGSIVFSVSPNPADNFITIHIDDAGISPYQGIIINGRGESVESFELIAHSASIELIDYLPGIYFLHIRNARGSHSSRKFSVIH
ncbi:MAG TPA: T9SS type A sorting domain-containing protein [Saprospiraceae bacterium]|nr:T9SS type A sorting domain-containing protein [Saprospiraceae bacterium]